jgi:hypothetical protein
MTSAGRLVKTRSSVKIPTAEIFNIYSSKKAPLDILPKSTGNSDG